jgi:hypothetical protein
LRQANKRQELKHLYNKKLEAMDFYKAHFLISIGIIRAVERPIIGKHIQVKVIYIA